MRFAFPCGLAIMIEHIGRKRVTLLISDGSGSNDAQSSVHGWEPNKGENMT